MIAVQYATGLFNVDVDLLQIVPRQVKNPVHIVAHHRIFRRRRRHTAQFFGFGKSFFPGLFRHVSCFELLLNLVNFRLRVVVAAHFLVDGLDLLVQVIFTLVALHLNLDAVLDAFFNGGKRHFSLQKLVSQFKPLGYVVNFKGFLLFPVVHLEVWYNSVCQRAGLLKRQNGEHGLLRNFFVVFAVLFQSFMHGAHKGLALILPTLPFSSATHSNKGALFVLAQVFPGSAINTFKKHFNGAVRQAQHLQNLADHAHFTQILGIGFFQLRLTLGHKKNLLAVCGLCGFNGLDGGLTPHKKRHDGAGKHDHLAQRHDGQFHKSVSTALVVCHILPLKKRRAAARAALQNIRRTGHSHKTPCGDGERTTA